MTLYTSKVVAQWLCLTERRVRQLRDEGVIVEMCIRDRSRMDIISCARRAVSSSMG